MTLILSREVAIILCYVIAIVFTCISLTSKLGKKFFVCIGHLFFAFEVPQFMPFAHFSLKVTFSLLIFKSC